jgi:predicted O-linked N-acetylglucosamine transferase (SPINDLY family)
MIEGAFNLGLALLASKDTKAAVACFERATDLKPDSFAAQYHLACSLRDLGDLSRAIGHFQCALALNPQSVDAHIDLANILHALRRDAGAILLFQRALGLNPKSAIAHNNLGNSLVDARRLDEGIESFRRALSIEPNYVFAQINLGSALMDAGLQEEAIEVFRQGIAGTPSSSGIHSNLVYVMAFVPGYGAKDIVDEARRWAGRHAVTGGSPPVHPNDPDPNRRLRIGYVSAEFYDHVLSYYYIPLFKNHDREKYEIFCYGTIEKSDHITEQVPKLVDGWRDITSVDDDSAAKMIREDRIDVLVDISMHMANGRRLVFVRKPAPVQVCWLAYPGTTGIEAMGYRLTDPFLDPPPVPEGTYSEKSVHLPDTFWCYDPLASEPGVSPLPAARSGYVTFGCLNNFYKVNAPTLELWARVLRAVPGSRLILLAPLGGARSRTLALLEKAGVEPSRVEFVPRQSRDSYLKVYQRIDLCLDTLPYNGHTTSLDSLWMGVPVLTLVGTTLVGRAGYCQAKNLDLPELITTTPDEFVARAIALAGDLPGLAEMRSGLRARMEKSPLMDAPRFARGIEAAYRSMWREWCESRR